jgi:hypothetical protein
MPNQSGYAVGWGALALINAGLAQGKGRSGLVWFLVSLFLGPAATLLIVLLPPPTAGQEMRRQDWIVVAVVLVAVLGALFLLLGASVMSPQFTAG